VRNFKRESELVSKGGVGGENRGVCMKSSG